MRFKRDIRARKFANSLQKAGQTTVYLSKSTNQTAGFARKEQEKSVLRGYNIEANAVYRGRKIDKKEINNSEKTKSTYKTPD